MKVKIKCGDRFIEVDDKFPEDRIDTFEKIKVEEFEDTKEYKISDLLGEENETK